MFSLQCIYQYWILLFAICLLVCLSVLCSSVLFLSFLVLNIFWNSILFIVLFFVCTGSSLLCELSLVAVSGVCSLVVMYGCLIAVASLAEEQELLSSCGARASHCSGFSCCRARPQEQRLRSCNTVVGLRHRESSWIRD